MQTEIETELYKRLTHLALKSLADSVSSLALLDKQMSELFSEPKKDEEWYYRAQEVIKTSIGIQGFPEIKKVLGMSVISWHSDYCLRTKVSERSTYDLYIMESKLLGGVKIGRTYGDVEKRARQLKVSCPDIKVVAIFEAKGHAEAEVHRLFSDFGIGGEWFSMSVEEAKTRLQKILT